ncbi:hypothetical protein EBZ38_10745, partial [bacterium]|nr:hypothetical protein [bacterium]
RGLGDVYKRQHLEALKQKAEHDSEKHKKSEHIDSIKKSVETHAISGKELNPTETAPTERQDGYINRELKDMAYRRTMNSTRRNLSAPSRLVSKLIHQPVVEKVSEVASASVARPSGIIGGGLCAVTGSFLLLWLTKKYGYEYNYLMFIIFLAAGFVFGVIIELVLYVTVTRRRK